MWFFTPRVPHMLISHQRTLQETKLRSKIWPPYKFGSLGINKNILIIRNFRVRRNPLQNISVNKKLSNSAESNRVALLHIVKAWNNQLFRLFNQLFFKKYWKWFWNRSLIAVWIKTQSSFAKNIMLRCKNCLKVWLAFWKLIHSFHKIVNLHLKRFTIFKKTGVTFAKSVFVNQFQICKIIFQIIQLFFQCFDSIFQPIIHAFHAVVQKG